MSVLVDTNVLLRRIQPTSAHHKAAVESALREWTVSRRVNRTGVGDDDPTILEKVEAA